MIKLTDILRDVITEGITEGKQVGSLYHYTSKDNLKNILSTNTIYAGDEVPWQSDYVAQSGVSTTRDKNFHKKVRADWSISTEVRIELDGDKLSHKYKIIPVQFQLGRDPYADWDEYDDDELKAAHGNPRQLPKYAEAEERVLGDITNVKDYIISIDIL